MNCTCFSTDKDNTVCDHKRTGEKLYVALTDDQNDVITIDDHVIRELAAEKGGKVRDGSKAAAMESDDERFAAVIRDGQRTGQYYDQSYARASRERVLRDAILSKFAQAAPKDMYAAIEAWNADKARARTGETIYLGANFPPGYQFLHL